jgi:hypothetical protein
LEASREEDRREDQMEVVIFLEEEVQEAWEELYLIILQTSWEASVRDPVELSGQTMRRKKWKMSLKMILLPIRDSSRAQ